MWADLSERVQRVTVVIDGVPCVRQADVCRLFAMSPGIAYRLQKIGWLKPVRVPAPVSRQASHGFCVYWTLEQVRAYALQRERHHNKRRWTLEQRQRMQIALVQAPLDQVAREQGRTVRAIRSQLGAMRRSIHDVMHEHGYWSTGEIAELLGLSKYAIQLWCNHGSLPHVRRRNRQGGGDRFIRVPDLRAWLRCHPEHLNGLSPLVRRRLRLSADPRFNRPSRRAS